VIGDENLRTEFQGYGLTIVGGFCEQDAREVIVPDSNDAVVVAIDRTLDNRKLTTTYAVLLHGAHFYANNADRACPMPGDSIPNAGAPITCAGAYQRTPTGILGREAIPADYVGGAPMPGTATRTLRDGRRSIGDRHHNGTASRHADRNSTDWAAKGVAAERFEQPPTGILDNIGSISALVV
jgi:hypothetical protein